MRILEKNIKKGVIKLVPETLDDLWSLYNVVESGDKVYARTTRAIKITQEDARPTKGKRRRLNVGLNVEKVAFHESVNRLRIMGLILEAPEKIPGIIGVHHTISIYPRKALTIEKDKWSLYQLDRIKTACEEKSQPIIVIGMDDEKCCIAVLRHHGIDVKNEIDARLPGKLEAEKRSSALSNYFKSALQFLLPVWNNLKSSIAVVGPGYIKKDFVKYVKEQQPSITKNIEAVRTTSIGGLSGIKEALRSGILEKVVKKIRIAEETRLVETVLSRLGSQRGDVSYGIDEVEKAASMGAVDHILVADISLRKREVAERQRVENLIRNVEKIRGNVMIVNTGHEAGKKLLGLGGVAALLRFPI